MGGAALAAPGRSDADRARDAGRKPDQVLAFFGIRPGMHVLDLFSGGGYYSELLAQVVGDEGRVVAQSNEAYLGFVGDEFTRRYADNRLPNVDILMAENNELELEAESDLLRNLDDDHSTSVFDPGIRGKTDRFLLRFRKRHAQP